MKTSREQVREELEVIKLFGINYARDLMYKDGSQASILSEAPLKSIMGSPLPKTLYAISISAT